MGWLLLHVFPRYHGEEKGIVIMTRHTDDTELHRLSQLGVCGLAFEIIVMSISIAVAICFAQFLTIRCRQW